MINTGEVASFIDNVIVGMEEEKRHDKVVKKVVNRSAENNLYVKSEKCKWNIREVKFLRMVIGSKGIRIEEEKVKRVLDWLISKIVKNI